MHQFSRRSLLAGVAAVQVGACAPTSPAIDVNPPTRSHRWHSVAERVRAWIAEKDAQDELQREWQDVENDLCIKIRPLRMSLTRAERSGLPEARRMRALMKRIKAADRRLDKAAGKIVLMRPRTPRDALAKIEMALRIQEPLDCDEYSWALMQDGFERLRDLL